MRQAALLLVLLALLAGRSAPAVADEENPPPPPSPFAGWDEVKVKKDRRTARLKILGNIRKWTTAKATLALKCAMCAGAGRIRRAARGRWVWLTCKRCDGSKYLPHTKNWTTVHWDHHTLWYRTEKRRKALDRQLKDLRRNPRPATELQISRSKVESLVVHGNWAEAEVTEHRGKKETLTRQVWIREGKAWCLEVPKVDGPVFVRHDYPDLEAPEAGPTPEPGSGPVYRVLEVLDDQTIVVESKAGREPVALCGIEAKRQRTGRRILDPAQVLRDLLLGEEVRLEHPGPASSRDGGGRLRAFVIRQPEGLNVNAELVRQGYAKVIVRKPYPHAEKLRALEQRAQTAKKGIWAEGR